VTAGALPMRPELAGIEIADAAEPWAGLGFTVAGGELMLGGVRLAFGTAGAGITAWTLRHVDPRINVVDGLPTAVTTEPAAPDDSPGETPNRVAAATAMHPNGALGLDHIVIATPDFDRTAAALDRAGLSLRRVRHAGATRQGFRRLGPAIMEVVEGPPAPAGPARFWGLVITVADLDALYARLAPHLGQVRDAVQSGRRIATLGGGAGLSPKVAFMDPKPGRTA
jgi:hypothetical protein